MLGCCQLVDSHYARTLGSPTLLQHYEQDIIRPTQHTQLLSHYINTAKPPHHQPANESLRIRKEPDVPTMYV